MDIRINNVSFNGKNEMFYGLKQAAKEACSFEESHSYGFGPHSINKELEMAESKGKLNAYLDMVFNDEYIKQGFKDSSKDTTLINDCKKILAPKDRIFYKTNPFNVFAKSLLEFAENTDITLKKDINTFLNKIKCKKM